MDNIDEFLASLSPEELKYLHSKIMSGEQGEDMTAEAEEPNEAKGDNATVPKTLAKTVTNKKDSIPLKEAEMFDEED